MTKIDGLASDQIALLSAERLQKFIGITSTAEEALELHQCTLRIGASLMVALGTLEVALRNAISQNLTSHFESDTWLLEPPSGMIWRQPEKEQVKRALDSARRAEYAKLSQSEKAQLDTLAYPNGRPAGTSHAQRAKDRRSKIVVSQGKVIAQLTLYFWKKIYGPDYEQSLWRTTLKRTFPDKKVMRAEVAQNLEVIYQARNRLAHLEPMIGVRFERTVSAARYLVSRLGVDEPSGEAALAQLVEPDLRDAEQKRQNLEHKIRTYEATSAKSKVAEALD